MEESKKREAAMPEEGRMIELTPAMEIPSGVATKIIDLTEVLQAQPAKATPERKPEPESEQPPVDAAETGDKRNEDIESDVDTAFDVIEAEKSGEEPPVAASVETETIDSETASDGEEMALTPDEAQPDAEDVLDLDDPDQAPEISEAAQATPEQKPASDEPAAGLDGALDPDVAETAQVADDEPPLQEIEIDFSEVLDTGQDEPDEAAGSGEEAQAAEFEMAAPDASTDEEEILLTDPMVPEDEEEPEAVLALTDIVDSDAPVTETDEVEDEEISIELTDIVDPDAPVAETGEAEDEEISIELTDIVDPDAPVTETDEAEDEEISIELTDIVDPHAPVAETGEAEDEEVSIELTDIVQPGALESGEAPRVDDDEVIELTDIVDPAELAALSQAAAGASPDVADGEVLNLIDVADPAKSAHGEAGTPADDEVALDLEDIVSPADVAAALEQSRSKSSHGDDDEADEVIDLFDKVEVGGRVPGAATEAELTDQVVRLDSILNHVLKNRNKLVEDITLAVEEALVKVTAGEDVEDDMAIGKDLEEIKKQIGELANLNGEALEEAVEKVIRAKYGQNIDQLIANIVEKVVTREIESLKRNLLEDQDLIDD